MLRHILGIVAVAGLLTIGLTLSQTGWHIAPAGESATALSQAEDPLNTVYGRRFTHNQPLHWRDVLLAH